MSVSGGHATGRRSVRDPLLSRRRENDLDQFELDAAEGERIPTDDVSLIHQDVRVLAADALAIAKDAALRSGIRIGTTSASSPT